ncbi:hypothetical protein ANCDUO_20016, partial [Ancylostoma duodenale]
MLINTINVSSWLILNALVPKALPDDVRSSVRTMARDASACEQDGPYAELENFEILHIIITRSPVYHHACAAVDRTVYDGAAEDICALGAKENWKQDFSSSIAAKTALPDFYENEVFDCLSAVRDALATTGYPGEACLFSRERFRSTLVDIFVHLITALPACAYDEATQYFYMVIRANDK